MTEKMTKRKKEDVLREAANLLINREGADWKALMRRAEKVEDPDEALDLLEKMARKEDTIFEQLRNKNKKQEKHQFTWPEMVERRLDCPCDRACVVDNLGHVDCYLCFSEGIPPKEGIGPERMEQLFFDAITKRQEKGFQRMKSENDLLDWKYGKQEGENLTPKKKEKFSIPVIFRKWKDDFAATVADIFIQEAKHKGKPSTFKKMIVRCQCDNLTSSKDGICPSCKARKNLERAEAEVKRKRRRFV